MPETHMLISPSFLMLNCKLLFSSKERIRQYYKHVPRQYDEFFFLLYYLLLYVNNYLLTFKKICLISQTVRDLQRCAQHSSYADVKPIFTLHVTEQLTFA